MLPSETSSALPPNLNFLRHLQPIPYSRRLSDLFLPFTRHSRTTAISPELALQVYSLLHNTVHKYIVTVVHLIHSDACRSSVTACTMYRTRTRQRFAQRQRRFPSVLHVLAHAHATHQASHPVRRSPRRNTNPSLFFFALLLTSR